MYPNTAMIHKQKNTVCPITLVEITHKGKNVPYVVYKGTKSRNETCLSIPVETRVYDTQSID